LQPCFTPVASPESNGLAEAFVTTFKRDYVRVNPLPDAVTVLRQLHRWIADYKHASQHPSVYAIEEKRFC
jgi:transposase InsO family protein